MRYSRKNLPHIVNPEEDPVFPDSLVPDETGLIAIGGCLSDRVILEAYRKGIFPWTAGPPIMWYSPDPRMVLLPENFHLSERLARKLRQNTFAIEFDSHFEAVIFSCARVRRKHEAETWIGSEIMEAYTRLFHRGVAHCVSVFQESRLCGGLYGISLGRLFFGESMFSLVPDASKTALYHLCRWTAKRNFQLIDCQVYSDHLARLGAEEIPRIRFLDILDHGLKYPDLDHHWQGP